jgi:hypothetical protein
MLPEGRGAWREVRSRFGRFNRCNYAAAARIVFFCGQVGTSFAAQVQALSEGRNDRLEWGT